ncbi:13854_t:CDS:1 [Acaulospora colombiana]|uniref:13854_t:CDS:1 n=1 Tax=Acaulospora colombiana TaxID=27376 RepID=A0ACA9PZ40_9GLOM|nr:13854_t:CDS:1 [Acaulospora colombiana]
MRESMKLASFFWKEMSSERKNYFLKFAYSNTNNGYVFSLDNWVSDSHSINVPYPQTVTSSVPFTEYVPLTESSPFLKFLSDNSSEPLNYHKFAELSSLTPSEHDTYTPECSQSTLNGFVDSTPIGLTPTFLEFESLEIPLQEELILSEPDEFLSSVRIKSDLALLSSSEFTQSTLFSELGSSTPSPFVFSDFEHIEFDFQ